MTSDDIHALRIIQKQAVLRAMNREDLSDQLIAMETINDIFHDIVKLAEGKWYEGKEEKDDEG